MRNCALTVGAYVAHFPDVPAPIPCTAATDLLLIGADREAGVTRAALPPARQAIVVSTVRPDFELFTVTAALDATCVTAGCRDRAWLEQQLLHAAGPQLEGSRTAGFRLGHADPQAAAERYCRRLSTGL